MSSPDAPAGGWNVALSIPVISIRKFSSSCRTSKLPCVNSAGVAGCELAKVLMPATKSANLGLYFIVHEPSG